MDNKNVTAFLSKADLKQKPKFQVFNLLMALGPTMVFVDPNKQDVTLPDYLLNAEHVALEFGYNLPKPIPDLIVSQFAIEATLSFNNAPFNVVIPWDAVTALTDKRGLGVFYGTELSAEDVLEVQDVVKQERVERQITPEERRRSFKVIKGGRN